MKLKKWIAAILMVLMTAVTATAFAACSPETEEPPEEQVSGPEVGVYYYDTTADEYQISLSEGNVFTFLVMGENKTGTYTLTGEELVLDFARAEDGELTATLSGDELSLTYRESAMRFLKKIEYTVTFDSAGGESVSPVTVINGRTVSRPEDPTQDGMLFVGWYKDEAHTQPFLFDAEPVRANSTLYAYWVARTPGMSEYTVEFDLNGGDGETPAGVSTIGGTIPADQLPTAERDGYTFLGWYVSAYDNASKPTYEYTAGTVLTENTTLYAQWAAEAEPAASVSAAGVTWESVSGAQTYYVRIESDALDANADYDSGILSGTTYALDFSALPAGEYTVTVLSSATQNPETDADAAQSVRHYRNKALSRVTGLDVTADMVHWEPVDGAQCYYLTIDCGNDAHVHEGLSVGSATSLPISGCAMQEGGIRITVWAEADGLLASTPVTYVYDRTLAQVSGFEYDEETETLYWSPVADAIGYVVSVSVDGSSIVSEEIGSRTSYSLKGIPAGEVVFAIYPVTKGYNSPVASEYKYTKATPAAPSGLHVDGTVVSWNATGKDVTYTVEVNGTSYTVNTNSYTLNTNDLLAGAEFTVRVRTNGTPASLWSDSVTFLYQKLDSNSLSYQNGVLSWTEAIGATGYEVRVNSGTTYRAAAGENSYPVELTLAGMNLLEVRVIGDAEWAQLTVYAYEIKFDTRGGSAVDAIYVAYGDTVTLPGTEQTGYDFSGWYNVPNGTVNGGRLYGESGEGYVFTDRSDLVLYAAWTNAENYVQLNTMGGTSESNVAMVTYNQEYTIEVPVHTDATYSFVGWFDGPQNGASRLTDEEGNSIGVWNNPELTTVYAHWAQAFTFTQMSDGYAVSAGPEIDEVSILRVPATYNNLPVTFIGSAAFANCTSLEEVYIPDCVTEIGVSDDTGGPFIGCSGLTNVHVYETDDPAGIYSSHEGVLYRFRDDVDQLELAFYPAGRTGGYEIPADIGVDVIPARVFAASNITSITIPASVTHIGQSAFYECTQLTSVVFSAGNGGELTISDRAFHNCTALTSITLPARLAVLGEDDASTAADEGVSGVFTGCTSLANIYTENDAATASGHNSANGMIWKVVSSQNTLVYCPLGRTSDSVNPLAIPNGITAIGESAFEGHLNVRYVTIPSYVTSIGANAFASSRLSSITFQGGAAAEQTIGEGAFAECGSLASVTFADNCNVTTIGASAFSFCDALTALTLPASLVSVGENAFANCTSLTTLTLQGSNAASQTLTFADSTFTNCASLTTVHLSANVGVFDFVTVFESCPRLHTITVDAGNPYLSATGGILYGKNDDGENDTIYFYSRLLTADAFTIPAGITTIGSGAFANNSNLDSITIGADVTSIGTGAFENVANLSSVTFADSTTNLTIGERAFAGCTALTEISLTSRVTAIGAQAFYGTRLASVEIPNTVTRIGSAAFAGISTLTTFTFATGGTAALTIEDGTANGIIAGGQVDEITLPVRLTSIGENAFYNVSSLTAIFYEEGTSQLTAIGDYAFAGTNINDIIIPDAVTAIGAYAFANNSSLEEVTLSASLETLGENAFSGCTVLKGVSVPETNKHFVSESGVLYDAGKTQILVFPIRFESSTFTLPTTVKTIADSQFAGSGLTGITLHSGVTSIGANAFDGSAITSITLPAGLTDIGDYAFANTASLEAVSFGIGDDEQDATPALTAIPASAFRNSAIKTFDFSALTQLTSIGHYAFYNCTGLTVLEFPSTLETVGNLAFRNCTGLTEVDFGTNTVLTSIGQEAFAGSGSASAASATVSLPEGAQNWELGNDTAQGSWDYFSAFYESNYTSITFADNTHLTTIPDATFARMTRLTSFTIPASVTSIGYEAFAGYSWGGVVHGLESIEIPATVTYITNGAFSSSNLKSVVFADGNDTLSMESNVFSDCTQLISVTLSNRITSIPSGTFDGCSALSTITFSESGVLETINNTAFAGAALTSITLPEGLESFASSATSYQNGPFYSCAGLTSVTLPSTLTAIGGMALSTASAQNGSALQNIYVTDYTYTTGSAGIADFAAALADATGKTENGTTQFFSVDGILYSLTKNAQGIVTDVTFRSYPFGRAQAALSVPEGVTTIGAYAFGGYAYTSSWSPSWSTYADLSSLTLPSTLTTIANNAFYYNAGLTSIDIPDSVTSIGNYAFSYCTGLTQIELPESLVSLGTYVFQNASNLASVTFPTTPAETFTTIPDGAFRNTAITTLTIPASITTIGSSIVYGCNSLESIIFASGSKLASIGRSAFQTAPALKTVGEAVQQNGETVYVIPSGVTQLNDSTFYGCSSLQYVRFGAGAAFTTFGSAEFQDCTSLTEIDLSGTSVTILPDYLFSGTTNLTTVKLPETLTQIGSGNSGQTFYRSGITSITIPASVTRIQYRSFDSCTALETVTFEEGSQLTSLGWHSSSWGTYGVFSGCTSLTSINLPDSVTEIPANAFYNCSSLSSIRIPARAASIGNNAFYGCAHLASVDIVPGLSSIGNSAFFGCTALTSINLYSSLVSLGSNAFGNCPNIYFNVDEANAEYVVRNGILYNSVETQIISVFDLPAGPVVIPSGVNSIPEGAFANSPITSITLPSSITEISANMFAGCTNLQEVICLGRIISIGANAFDGCTALKTLKYTAAEDDTAQGVEIGRYVTSIGNYAFRGTGIELLTFEAGGTSPLAIGQYAFAQTTSLASAVQFPARLRTYTANYQNYVGLNVGAFEDSALTAVSFEDSSAYSDSASYLNIDRRAFAGCVNLESVVLPEYMSGQSAMSAIGNYVFDGCVSLKSIDFGASVNPFTEALQGNVYSIGGYAFRNCISLTTLQLPANASFSGSGYTFIGCTGLTSVSLPAAAVTSVGLSSYSMPSGLFVGCTKLETVTLTAPQGLLDAEMTAIGGNWFAGCTGLTTVTLPENLVSIFPGAFAGCSQLASISLPASLQAIGNGAFYGCTELESVTLPEDLTTLGGGVSSSNANSNYGVFENSGLASISIPASVATITNRAFAGCKELASITVLEGNTAYQSIDGNLYSADGRTLLRYAPGQADGAFTIPSTVTTIAAGAFAGSNITSVTIPASVTSLGEGAFAGCAGLTSVNMTDSALTAIPASAFEGCVNLTAVTLPANLTSIGSYAFAGTALSTFTVPAGVTSIGNGAFANCGSLTAIGVAEGNTAYVSEGGNLYTADGTTLVQYAVGNTAQTFTVGTVGETAVTTISASAFEGATHLTSVTIGAAVTTIGERAFAGCTNIEEFIVEEGNTRVFVIGNALYVHATSSRLTLIAYAAGAEGTSFTIGDDFEFPEGTSYEQVAIGAGAFVGSNLTEINLSSVVYSIGTGAFEGISGLTINVVYYPDPNSYSQSKYAVATWTDYTNGMITCTVVFHANTLPAESAPEA